MLGEALDITHGTWPSKGQEQRARPGTVTPTDRAVVPCQPALGTSATGS